MADIITEWFPVCGGMIAVFLVLAGMGIISIKDFGGQNKRKPEQDANIPMEVYTEEVNPSKTRFLQTKDGVVHTITKGIVINAKDKKVAYIDNNGREIVVNNYDLVKPLDSFTEFMGNSDMIWKIYDEDYLTDLQDENARLKMRISKDKEELKEYITTTQDGANKVAEMDKSVRTAKYGRSGGAQSSYSPWWRRQNMGGYGGGWAGPQGEEGGGEGGEM